MVEVNLFSLIMKSHGFNVVDENINAEKDISKEELEIKVRECFIGMQNALLSMINYNPTGDMIEMELNFQDMLSNYSAINEALAYFAVQSGNDELSYTIAKRAADYDVKCENKEAYANYTLGRCLFELEDYEYASRYLNKSLELEDNNPYACVLLGRSYHQLKQIDYAKKEFNNALECDLKDCEIIQPKEIDFLRHFYAAMFYQMNDLQDQAVKLFEKCIKMKPNEEYLYVKTILCYQDLVNHEEAIRCARYGMMNCKNTKGLKILEDMSLKLLKKT